MTLVQRQECMYYLSKFMVDSRPVSEIITEGELEIFFELIYRPHRRLQILCSTQYGKSLFVALACIVITCIQDEIVAVVAPTNEKAKIIMRYYIEHLADHEMFYCQLEKNTRLERLRMEETKERIILREGGGIYVISAQAGNSKKGVESAMGAGARIVIQDESCLLPDPIEATIFRMIAGKGSEAFYCKIGNPFYRNHFYKSWQDPVYHKIFIDYQRGLEEGRYSLEFIEEARKKPLFSILFECKFPGEGMFDASGYLPLIQENQILLLPKLLNPVFVGRRILGIDPAGEGKDAATFCIRDRFRAEIIQTLPSSNPKQIAEIALTLIDQFQIDGNDVVVDAMGVGADVGKEIALATAGRAEVYTVLAGNSPLKEKGYNGRFFDIKTEEKDGDGDLYLNLRALMYFRMKNWLSTGGIIIDEVGSTPLKGEILTIRYKRSLQGNKIQLMSKKDMMALGLPSPNMADALALTFLRDLDEFIQTEEEREKILREIEEEEGEFDRYSVF